MSARTLLILFITAVGIGLMSVIKVTCDLPVREEQVQERHKLSSEKGKRNCKASCKAIGGWHTAHGPNKCVCRDRDGCTTVFMVQAHESGNVQQPYRYHTPVTVGKCAGRSK